MEEMSPDCQALCEAARGMTVDELEAELAKDERVKDPRTLAAYLLSMG